MLNKVLLGIVACISCWHLTNTQTSNDPDDYVEATYSPTSQSMTASRVIGLAFWLKYAKSYDDACTFTIPTLSQSSADVNNSGLESAMPTLPLSSGNVYTFYFDQSTLLVNINGADVHLTRFQGPSSTGKTQASFVGAMSAGKGSGSNSTVFMLNAVTMIQVPAFVTPKSTPAGTKTILSYDRSSYSFLTFYSPLAGQTDIRFLKAKDDLTIGYNHIRLDLSCTFVSMSGSYLHCLTAQQYVIFKVDEASLGISLSSVAPITGGLTSFTKFCALSETEGLLSETQAPGKFGLRYFKLNQTGIETNRPARWSYSAINYMSPTSEGCYVQGSLQNNSQVVPSVVHYLRDNILRISYVGELKPSPATGFGKPEQTLAVVDGVFFALESNKLFVQTIDQGNSLSDGNNVKLLRPKYNLQINQLSAPGVGTVLILPNAQDMSRFYLMTYTTGAAATAGTFYPVSVTPFGLKCTGIIFEDEQDLSKDYYFTTGLGKNPTYRNETALLVLLVNSRADYDFDRPNRTAALVILVVTSILAGVAFVYVAYGQIQQMRESAKVANANAGSVQELAPIRQAPTSANTTNNNILTMQG